MRIIDGKYRKALLANKFYQRIINSRPDCTLLREDASEFERWIKEVHHKERLEREREDVL